MNNKIKFPGVKVVKLTTGSVYVKYVRYEFEQGLDVDGRLEALYKALHCDTVQIVNLTIDGKRYAVFFDEEGKINGPWVPTLPLYDKHNKCYDIIPGNFVVVKEDEDENFLPMTIEEISIVEDYLAAAVPQAAEIVRKMVAEKEQND